MTTRFTPTVERDRPSIGPLLLDLATSALLGLGLILTAAPGIVFWLIHGDRERYLWLISGPAPFDQWGSGPYQLGIYVLLTLAAGCCLAMGVVLRWAHVEGELPRRGTFVALCGAAAATTATLVFVWAFLLTAVID